MTLIFNLYDRITSPLSRAEPLLPLLARFLFAALFLGYYWVSGLTKLGDGIMGIFQPSVGAYAQIFPRASSASNLTPQRSCRREISRQKVPYTLASLL